MDDVGRYRSLLAPIEQAARDQPWAEERPWRVATHVAWDGQVPVVDLHDLKAGLARDAVKSVLSHPPEAGAVLFVYGRGRHTLAAGSVLRNVVRKELERSCAAEAQWSYRPAGPARWAWITDWERAPRQVTGGASAGLGWVAALLLLTLALWALGRELGVW